MGWNFRKRISWGGINLNFGKKGFNSVSIGGKGITYNLNAKGAKTTYSLYGTGLSYSTQRQGLNLSAPLEILLKVIILLIIPLSYLQPISVDKNNHWKISLGVASLFFIFFYIFPTIFTVGATHPYNLTGLPAFIILSIFIFALTFILLRINNWFLQYKKEQEQISIVSGFCYIFWQKCSISSIVDCVNQLHGTEYKVNNLVKGHISEQNPSYYNIILFCGGQTVRNDGMFVRNRNVNYVISIHEICQTLRISPALLQKRLEEHISYRKNNISQ